MSLRRLFTCLLFLGLMAAPLDAFAAKYVVYVEGRSMSSYPPNAFLGHSSTWTDFDMGINGSAALTDATTRATVSNDLYSHCAGGNSCIIVAYSAGVARTLLAFQDLKAAGKTLPGLLWIEAPASLAGGTPVASVSTNAGVRLLAKLFLSGVPESAPIDSYLDYNTMRGTYGYMQNGSPVPMYHLAGGQNTCNRISIQFLESLVVGFAASEIEGAPSVADYLSYLTDAEDALSIVSVIAMLAIEEVVNEVLSWVFEFFAPKYVTLCGNHFFPGDYGDGIAPVSSAAGYADTNAHANHCDGSAKFVNRAYENAISSAGQPLPGCPLFPYDHMSMPAPATQMGSIRLAVPKTTTCALNAYGSDTTDPPASIVYQDADGSQTTQVQPIAFLDMCGNDVWNGESTQYSTCLGPSGCCNDFSTGNIGSCTCGETLCVQAQGGPATSYFSGRSCSGDEYSSVMYSYNAASQQFVPVYSSWDGNGQVGETLSTVSIMSRRVANGRCEDAMQSLGVCGCHVYGYDAVSMSDVRRVYRQHISTYPTDPKAVTPSNALPIDAWVVAENCQRGGQCN